MTDKELYRRTAKGDERAFEELVVRYESMVYNVTFGVLGNRDDAFDASQEALLHVWQSAGRYRGDCEVKTWIYGIAKNAALDTLRGRAKRMTVSIDENGVEIETGGSDDSVQDEIERRETVTEVRAAIASLPDAYREVIEMRELYSMEYEEIAKAAGIPVGTVKSRLSRARDELYEILKGRTFDNLSDSGTKSSRAPSKKVKNDEKQQ